MVIGPVQRLFASCSDSGRLLLGASTSVSSLSVSKTMTRERPSRCTCVQRSCMAFEFPSRPSVMAPGCVCVRRASLLASQATYAAASPDGDDAPLPPSLQSPI